jgi:uncharacterized DUF497 family protein
MAGVGGEVSAGGLIVLKISYDPAKHDRNIRERGLSFERVADFDFEAAVIDVDRRRDYGETRVLALGYLDARLHMLCYVESGPNIRVISFRKANPREIKRYEKAKAAYR